MVSTRCKSILLASLLAGGGCLSLRAQTADDLLSVPDLVDAAKQWAQNNLDTNVLAALPEVDEDAVLQFYRDYQSRMNGDLVVDVAALRDTARTVLPILQSHPETQPYAAWLQAQMPYLDVAEEIRQTTPPTPPRKPLPVFPAPTATNAPTSTNTPPKTNAPSIPIKPAVTNPPPVTHAPPLVIVNPPAAREREIWTRQESRKPWPPAAAAYVTELKSVFFAKKVPPQLVWVAEVESSFDRRAQSPAGAAGLFQLMPDTARRFGLSLWPLDQRYQAVPSAGASAAYFKYLHDHFHDWRLAMAAYNAGEGTVDRLLTRHKTREYDVIAGHLPAETQMYVPRVEAVLQEREGARLEDLRAGL